MDPSLQRAVERKLGARVASAAHVAGGDINSAFRVELSDGRSIFVKSHPRAPVTMFAAEARGLAWLGAARAVRVPEVLAVSREEDEGPRFLALELVVSRAPRAGFDEALGRDLAALHRCGAPSFGLDYDNFIGSLEQPNAPRPTWARFYREQRLEPQLRRATEHSLIDAHLRGEFDRLFDQLDDRVGPAEPPSRLHGDLWGGNLHVDDRGDPCLIDPAVYGGHREVDLAMMRLFGGFGGRVFAAYEEAWPLAPGAAERVPLYQLYPLLVHVNHFGRSYVGQLTRALQASLDAG
jgi:fructosamine-3-kinase